VIQKKNLLAMIEVSSNSDEEEEDEDEEEEEEEDEEGGEEEEEEGGEKKFDWRSSATIVYVVCYGFVNAARSPLARWLQHVHHLPPFALASLTHLPEFVFTFIGLLTSHCCLRNPNNPSSSSSNLIDLCKTTALDSRLWCISVARSVFTICTHLSTHYTISLVLKFAFSTNVAWAVALSYLVLGELVSRWTTFVAINATVCLTLVLMGDYYDLLLAAAADGDGGVANLRASPMQGAFFALAAVVINVCVQLYEKWLLTERGVERSQLLLASTFLPAIVPAMASVAASESWAPLGSLPLWAVALQFVVMPAFGVVDKLAMLASYRLFGSITVVSALSPLSTAFGMMLSVAWLGESFAFVYQYVLLIYTMALSATFALLKSLPPAWLSRLKAALLLPWCAVAKESRRRDLLLLLQ
jgi:hypothetical protein